MKKLLSYITILVILAGIFGLNAEIIGAEDPSGICEIKNGNGEVVRRDKTTNQKCKEFEILKGFTKKWIPDSETQDDDDGFVGPPDPYYHFLAPLPCEPGTPDCDSSGKLITFNPSGENKIGGYLNVMIRIFIGICAVLAVIMIVVGGIEYMTSELISNKENGRHRITGAIFGLVLALGAWTLLNTINPDLLNTELKSLENVTVNVTLEDQIKSYTGQGKCEPISSSSNPCSPDNLTASGFKNGTQASSICNGESRGNPTLASGVDKCSDGNSFSFGLFQVNILAHANEIPGGVCSGVFQKNGTGTQGTCLQSQSGICIKYDCSVKDTTKYQSCISYITNTTNNIKYALNLQTSRGWGQWGANKSCNF